jgi:hypothetical protein
MNKQIIFFFLTLLTISIAFSVVEPRFMFGFGAAILVILLTAKKQKEKFDTGTSDITWNQYFDVMWDDFGLIWLVTLVLVGLQGYIFMVASEYYKWDYNYLYDTAGQYVLASLLGWFSDVLIQKLYTNRKDIINRLGDKI